MSAVLVADQLLVVDEQGDVRVATRAQRATALFVGGRPGAVLTGSQSSTVGAQRRGGS